MHHILLHSNIKPCDIHMLEEWSVIRFLKVSESQMKKKATTDFWAKNILPVEPFPQNSTTEAMLILV